MLVSLIVVVADVATIVPPIPPVLICAANVSAPSVVASSVGVTANDPVLLVIVKLPLDVAKSDALVTVQYNVVASATLVVVTLNVRATPSFTLLVVGATEYVGGVVLVSLIVTFCVVLNASNDSVNVSAPSVVASAVVVNVIFAVLLCTTNTPVKLAPLISALSTPVIV